MIEKYKLYSSIDSMSFTRYARYKYLTENDTDIVALKQKIKMLVVDRNLSSYMNDVNWLELQNGIKSLPFPPAYNAKLIHQNENVIHFENQNNEPSFFGNWSNYWEEGMPIFFTIEWLEIRPKYRKHKGRLVPPTIQDVTKELLMLLNKLNIPFELKNESIFIYGYK